MSTSRRRRSRSEYDECCISDDVQTNNLHEEDPIEPRCEFFSSETVRDGVDGFAFSSVVFNKRRRVATQSGKHPVAKLMTLALPAIEEECPAESEPGGSCDSNPTGSNACDSSCRPAEARTSNEGMDLTEAAATLKEAPEPFERTMGITDECGPPPPRPIPPAALQDIGSQIAGLAVQVRLLRTSIGERGATWHDLRAQACAFFEEEQDSATTSNCSHQGLFIQSVCICGPALDGGGGEDSSEVDAFVHPSSHRLREYLQTIPALVPALCVPARS